MRYFHSWLSFPRHTWKFYMCRFYFISNTRTYIDTHPNISIPKAQKVQVLISCVLHDMWVYPKKDSKQNKLPKVSFYYIKVSTTSTILYRLSFESLLSFSDLSFTCYQHTHTFPCIILFINLCQRKAINYRKSSVLLSIASQL